LNVGSGSVTVTDLGSTNGTNLNGRRLVPQQKTNWNIDDELIIGSLHIKIWQSYEEQAVQSISDPGPVQQSSISSGLVPFISSGSTIPASLELDTTPILVGSDASCNLQVTAGNSAPHNCIIQSKGNRVVVTNLEVNHPVSIGGEPLTVGQETEWRENQTLQVGSALLNLSYRSAPSLVEETDFLDSGRRRFGAYWRYGLGLLILGGLTAICLGALAIIGWQRSDCDGFNLSCIFSGLGGDSVGISINPSGRATPTLQPTTVGQPPPTRADTIDFVPGTPIPTVETTTECTEGQSLAGGWLELPFPYQGIEPLFGGSAEGFKRISQRSRFGGRINSFFDHEFPVYPPAFGGREPQDLADTLVTFNGSKRDDGFAQDSDSADWYSGHSGIDYSPAVPREPTTPLLAAAKGRLLLAKIDSDGNHMVWLEHDPDGDNRYQYATLYFHLTPDEHFSAMVQTEVGTPIEAGQRIGTMGTTGRSTGVHLHFEVRKDINGDRRFSIFERVDPYGFFPSEEFPIDPWAEIVNWIDSRGNEYEHKGIISEYLWRHPLVDVVDASTECVQVRGEQVDLNLYPVLGFAVVNPGFTYIAGRDEQGNVLRKGPSQLRRITVRPERIDGVDINTIRLEFLDPVLDIWRTVDQTEAAFEPKADGSFVYSAKISSTGRYVLVGREQFDRVPPITTISLSGQRGTGDGNSFGDSVNVTLAPFDQGLIQSQIKETQYSLDCGKTWLVYEDTFTVTLNTPHSCGQAAESSETIALSENDFLLLAMSEDSENNIEQPPAQVRFTIEE
jgi:murein DD-endopeptidase MepM/ murein hydrolase activator NlpD